MAPLANLLFSFQGRMRRSHWWAVRIATTAALVILLVVFFGALGAIAPTRSSDTAEAAVGAVALVVGLPAGVTYAWIYLATSTKRLHDQDLTGWITLVFFVPYVGSLAAFVMLGCLDGTRGPNKFGPSDKYPTAVADVFA